MKTRLAILAALLLARVVSWGAGFGITWENDVFLHKDDNYTQGLELYCVDTVTNEIGLLERNVWGLRNRMYTPDDISDPNDQPWDRPWAGVTTVYHEWTDKEDSRYVMTGWELGVLGPESGVEWMQTTIHGWTGSRKPMGWSNQVPNEISAQFYQTYYEPLANWGTPGEWTADVEMPYGYCAGTTFDNVSGGLSVRLGWNIPPAHYCGQIEPKLTIPKPFAYLMADGTARYVLHNATLGHSFFRSHDDSQWDRELIPVVGEWDYGFCFGYKYFAVTYLIGQRTDEFENQPEPFEWGMIRLEFYRVF